VKIAKNKAGKQIILFVS